MKSIQQTPELRQLITASQKPIDYDPERYLCERMNEAVGNKTGYDCPVCKNKGVIYRLDESGNIVARPCKCLAMRKARKYMEQSGLGTLLDRCTLDSYIAKEAWQEKAKKTAEEFISCGENWLYVGGQVGSGKTHLCVAVTREFLQRGVKSLYVLWLTEAQRLRTAVNDDVYSKIMRRLTTVPVLYIDDFLKVQNGEYQHSSKPVPTPSEIKLAFDLVNQRYNNPRLITIFSSEHMLNEVSAMDSGLASRIYERCGGNRFVLEIERSESRNMRYAV